MDFLEILIIMFIGFLIGNYNGDQATLKDCATTGIAVMAGGGSVKCEVVKKESK